MAFHPTTLKRLFLLVLLAGVSLSRIWGAAPDSPIVFSNQNGITVSMVDAPTLGPSNTPRGEAAQWLKIELLYSVTPKGPVPFLDSVTFNITVEGRDLYASDAPTAEGVPVGLTGSATYVNIPANKECHAVFYIHPSTLVRYATKSGIRDFTNRFNIHVDALIGGKLADYFNLRKDPQGDDWYTHLRVTPGYVYRQDQCCFIINDPSYYPQLKIPASQQ